MKTYFQVNKATWPQIEIMMVRECPKALDIWWHLAPLTNYLGIVGISQKDIMSMIHVKSRTTVNTALNYLSKRGLLTIGREGVQNIYILNYNVLKKTPYNTTKKALEPYGIVFPANIVITKKNEREFYDRFKKLIRRHHTKYIKLSHVKFNKKANNGGKANRNGEKIKHRNGAQKARIRAKEKRDKRHGVTNDRDEAKRLHIGYQTKIPFNELDKNKKPVK